MLLGVSPFLLRVLPKILISQLEKITNLSGLHDLLPVFQMAQAVCNGCSDQDIVDNVPELQHVTGDELAHR